MKQIFTALLVVAFTYSNSQLQAQDKVSPTEDLMELSLEELMNVDIVSASKKSESLFDAPFSASVLTKEEIKNAGATSIMEAFRLMPGLIVREQSNGNFDIHVRGLDNITPNSLLFNSANTTTLVMIDNRPVYSYLQGGTLWETLPIDINDIERIEIVRGPAAAMYGPNAVSGVIHIITRKAEKEGVYAVANAQYGSNHTAITNASVGYQPNNKFSAIVSGNYQGRDRHDISYYRVKQNDFTITPDSLKIPNADERYPNPQMAVNKYGINAFVEYMPSQKIKLNVTTGLQNSEVQNAYADNLNTPLSIATSNTHYADVKATAYGFSGQVSYLGGIQNPTVGLAGSKYNFETIDGNVEYNLTLKNLVLKPGLTYRKAVYDDTQYWNAGIKEGIISGRREIITHAASIRTEYKILNEKLRLFGGIRADKFNYPDKYYISYQLATNYKVNNSHLLRLVHSRSNRAPFIYDTYLDKTIISGPIQINVLGNKDLKLVTSNMFEIGYRAKLAENLQIDVDVFSIQTKNYAEFIQGKTAFTPGTPTPLKVDYNIQNLPLIVQQTGVTFSVNYVLNKIQFKPFITIQQTKLKDYSSYNNISEASPSPVNPDPLNNNMNSGVGTTMFHKATPPVYGGAYINYQIHPKFNINLNSYYYSQQTFYHRNNIEYRDGIRGVDQISSKLILNARISYKPIKQLDIFVSGKNLTGDQSREFYKTDNIGTSVLAGVNFEF